MSKKNYELLGFKGDVGFYGNIDVMLYGERYSASFIQYSDDLSIKLLKLFINDDELDVSQPIGIFDNIKEAIREQALG